MSASSIFERQNTTEALVIACAFRRRYAVARRWRLLRVGVGLLIGTVGVLVAPLQPSTSDYVSALAAGWLVFGRAALATNEQRERRRGAVAQERFDTDVFDLPWSPSVVGKAPAPEDIRNWGRKEQDVDGLCDWYSDARPAQHPVDVLLCQRSIITWARQDHATYAQLPATYAGSLQPLRHWDLAGPPGALAGADRNVVRGDRAAPGQTAPSSRQSEGLSTEPGRRVARVVWARAEGQSVRHKRPGCGCDRRMAKVFGDYFRAYG